MVKGFVVKMIFNQIMDKIEKTSDKKIASDHERRIITLEKKYKACKCTK